MQKFLIGIGVAGTLFLAGCGSVPNSTPPVIAPGEVMIQVDVPETGVAAVDAEVAALIASTTEEVKKSAAELDQLESAAHAGLWVSGEIYTAGEDIEDVQSLVLQVSTYTGGAHPNTFFHTWTYRPERGEILKFASLWQAEFNPLVTLAPIVEKQLTEQLGEGADEEWIASGSGENFENYKKFAIDGRELVLFFDPYQVAAYAAGPQEVRVDVGLLQAILAPPFLLGTAGGDIDHGIVCETAGGTWDATYRECTGVGQQWCEQELGRWDECASACRHNPAAEMCTMQCVLVCEF